MTAEITFTPQRARRMAMRLEEWFKVEARDLPWRCNRTPYTSLVSEFMLQQTQVARVVDRFECFLNRFPTVSALAAATEQEVLREWQGLGYYRRARNLHAAAEMIEREYQGVVPDTIEALLRLPGVGRYTAGAIRSMAYDQPAPIVDGNVQRVLMRVNGWVGRADDKEAVKWAWECAGKLVSSANRPAMCNEGLMELGAIRCTPAQPLCDQCPLSRLCAAKRSGRQSEIPQPKRAVARLRVFHHAVVIQRVDGRVLFVKRPDTGLWSNMWQVPTIEVDREATTRFIRTRLPVRVLRLRRIGSFVHQTTHRTIEFRTYRSRSDDRCDISKVDAKAFDWRDPSNVSDLPLSNPQHRILELVSSRA